MAGGGEGEESNYWPGFVDALTTMVMVLTFVMMILGVMIFILSQEKEAKSLASVARALKMDGDMVGKLAAPELQEAILQAINRGGDGRGAGGDSSKMEGGRIAGGEQVGVAGGSGPAKDRGAGPENLEQDAGTGPFGVGEGAIPGAQINPKRPNADQRQSRSLDTLVASDDTAAATGGAGLSRPAATPGETMFETTIRGGLVGDKSAGLGGEYAVTDKQEVKGLREGVGARQPAGPGAVRFVYERDAIQLPPDAGEALKAFIMAQGYSELAVEAKAVAGQVGLTEARRKAYFRAMLVRSELIKQGLKPNLIVVQVKDADQISVPETVDVVRTTSSR